MTKESCADKNPNPPAGESLLPSTSDGRWTVLGICLFLAAITFTVFGQTLKHGFVNYDDDRYVYENALVSKGITGAGVAQAFKHGSLANWDPLTTLSHMLDCQFYGLHAGGHHLTNVLLHAASVILLFFALRKMTSATWRSAFVASLFAIHPLHVESVAWVAERKDTLSGLFFMLTLWAYAFYVKKPRFPRYLLVVLFFACGLMSKSMLVTLPFVLLLLDYWPLQRIAECGVRSAESKTSECKISRWRLIAEKLPLMAMSAGAVIMTVVAQGGAVKSLEEYPFSLRLENAIVSVANYIRQMFWPSGLAVFYPYPEHGLPVMEVGIAAVVLIGITVAAWCWRRTRPYVPVGWLWYLGMLVPVMGLVQAGAQAQADRYTYLPQIGLYIAITWLAAGATTGWRNRQVMLGCTAATAIVVLTVMAFLQTTYWRDSETLWKRTLACTENNVVAYNNLGQLELKTGRTDEAITEFQKAVESRPIYAQAHANLGSALLKKGRFDEAVAEYQKAVELQPGDASFWGDLGAGLLQEGRLDEAVEVLTKSLSIQENNYDVQSNLGFALFHQGKIDDAAAHFLRALDLKPDSVTVQKNLAGIAWVLSASTDDSARNGPKAVELAELVVRLSGGHDPVLISVLGAAYAEAGRFPDAVAAAQRARQLATAQGNSAIAAVAQAQLGDYQAGRPFRDPSVHIGSPAAK